MDKDKPIQNNDESVKNEQDTSLAGQSPTQDEPQTKKRNKKTGIIITVIAVVVAAILAIIGVLVFNSISKSYNHAYYASTDSWDLRGGDHWSFKDGKFEKSSKKQTITGDFEIIAKDEEALTNLKNSQIYSDANFEKAITSKTSECVELKISNMSDGTKNWESTAVIFIVDIPGGDSTTENSWDKIGFLFMTDENLTLSSRTLQNAYYLVNDD